MFGEIKPIYVPLRIDIHIAFPKKKEKEFDTHTHTHINTDKNRTCGSYLKIKLNI